MPIDAEGFGAGGVNVDANPLDLQPNELTNAQNATLGSVRKRTRALMKRPGMERLSLSPLGGAILGGIEAPYQGTAAAPANGVGTGIITTGDPLLGTGVPPGGSVTTPGSPGGTGNNPGGSGGAGTASSIFSSTPLFGGGRVIVIAQDSVTANGRGFIVAPSGWGSAAVSKVADGVTLATAYAPDVDTYPVANTFSAARIGRSYAIANGVFYYVGGSFSRSVGTAPAFNTIVKLSADGKVAASVYTVPDNPQILSISPKPSHISYITAMSVEWGNGDALWVAVWDRVTTGGSAGHYGRVLRLTGLDSGSYAMTEVYNSFNTNASAVFNGTPCIPFALENFLGTMWVGLMRTNSSPNHPSFGMFQVDNTQPDGWNIKKVTTDTTTSFADVTCMKAYNGTLYVGYIDRDPSVANAIIAAVDAANNYTTSLTGSGTGTATSPVGFVSMEVFNGKLYASYANSNVGARIWQFDGTTWTAVFTAGTAAEKQTAFILWADGSNNLYAFGGTPTSGTKSLYVSPDGVTWNDKTINFPVTPTNAIFAFDQV
jgi:hypothetical protein